MSSMYVAHLEGSGQGAFFSFFKKKGINRMAKSRVCTEQARPWPQL